MKAEEMTPNEETALMVLEATDKLCIDHPDDSPARIFFPLAMAYAKSCLHPKQSSDDDPAVAEEIAEDNSVMATDWASALSGASGEWEKLKARCELIDYWMWVERGYLKMAAS